MKKPPGGWGFLAVSTVRAPEGIRTPNLLIRSCWFPRSPEYVWTTRPGQSSFWTAANLCDS
jgi:hypothetical protein